MNKRILLAILLVGFSLALIGLIVYKALNPKASANFPKELPAFELITIGGTPFTIESLSKSTVTVVFYTPGCLFCEHEGKELVRHATDFTGCQLLFITSAPVDSAIAYTQRTGIGAVPHYCSLVDTAFKTPLLFSLHTIPTTLIYDENRKLIKAFEGEVNAVKLLKTLREYEAAKE